MRTQTFGIEMELTGITRSRAAKVIAAHFGTESWYLGAGYDTYAAKDDKGRTWKAMSDSSIYPQRKLEGRKVGADIEYRTEVVSPILRYEDIEILQELVRELRAAGAFANNSCGIHIHVGAERFTPKTLRNIVNIIASKEDLLYKALEVDVSRMGYCQKTNAWLLEHINREKPKTMAELADLWYHEAPSGRSAHYNRSRYHGLNLHATFTKGTIEFRLFNGTTHAGKIKAYIQLCLAITH